MRLHLLALLLGTTLASPALSDALPDLGDQSQAILSPQQEKRIAAGALRYLRLSPQWLGDAEINDYLNQLTARLIAENAEIKQTFSVVGLQDDSINAFAVPGGVLGVNSGLILASQTESELAGVMAHEMAHVTQHHISRLIEAQKRSLWPTVAAMAAAIIAARNSSTAAAAGLTTVQALNIQNTLDFTRTHEREADRIGMRYLQQAGFDPQGMSDFFMRLQNQMRFAESGAPGYLRTHPLTEERIADSRGRLRDLPYRQYPDSLDYLLVREKIRTLSLPVERLKIEFENRIKGNSGQAQSVARYGLARLWLRERNLSEAAGIGEQLLKDLPHAMTTQLQAEILLARQEHGRAIQLLRTGLENHPDAAALRETLIQALSKNGQGKEALQLVEDYRRRYPDSIDAWEWQAQIHNKLGQEAESHLALAEFYWRLGAGGDAMRQLRIARQQGNVDGYTAARISSRLKEMQMQMREQDAQR